MREPIDHSIVMVDKRSSKQVTVEKRSSKLKVTVDGSQQPG